ncbi:MAG TPA: PilZ domain-containing protein [Candidatus Sulfopaludibacter sp.]|nr:PilZ domain-containing protein [Candidatus Sulfopaludibacter sp.]
MPEIERRSTRRYPLQLQVRYRTTSARLSLSGKGQTLNISSAGLLIASPQMVREGLRLQLNVEWPWMLDDRTPLQLIAESRVVRADASQFAVTLERYQFRTSGRQSAPVDRLSWPVTA